MAVIKIATNVALHRGGSKGVILTSLNDLGDLEKEGGGWAVGCFSKFSLSVMRQIFEITVSSGVAGACDEVAIVTRRCLTELCVCVCFFQVVRAEKSIRSSSERSRFPRNVRRTVGNEKNKVKG